MGPQPVAVLGGDGQKGRDILVCIWLALDLLERAHDRFRVVQRQVCKSSIGQDRRVLF